MKDTNFPKNLIYILNSPSQPNELRCLAGTTLKGQMEVNIQSFTNETIEYFKTSMLSCYFDRDVSIRKNITNLINTFIRHCGIDIWPELLELLEENINKKEGNEMSLETLNIILEDSPNIVEEKFSKTLKKIIEKVIFVLQNSNTEQIYHMYFQILNMFLENCQDIVLDKMREIVAILKQFSNSSDRKIRNYVGKCWYTVVHLDKVYMTEYYEDLISFFLGNFNDKNYEQSFVSAEFFQFLISPQEAFLKKDMIKNALKGKLNILIPTLLKNMKLSTNDINYLDNKFKNETVNAGSNSNSSSGGDSSDSGSNNSNSQSNSNSNSNNNDSTLSSDESANEEDDNGNNTTDLGSESGSNGSNNSNCDNNNYNPDCTLRKCCSRMLDNLSFFFPQETFAIIRLILENDIQSTDDLIKERSILAFGAIGRGCYQQVINHLRTLIPFLIRELRHQNKFVRAITCWTLSRYTKYILVDNCLENKNELFKEYLTEILIKFLDKDNMVRVSSRSAFQEMILVNKSLVEPYLFDVFKIIANVFDNYTGLNLLSVYNTLILLMDTYPNVFQNQNFVEDIVKCIVQKWYELVKVNDLLTLPVFFDVISCLIRVSGEFLVNYCDYFLIGCLKIIEQNLNELSNNNFIINGVDKDLLTKSIDIISNLSLYYSDYIKKSAVKVNIVEFLFEIMKSKDLYILHYAIALFGDLIKVDPKLFSNKCEQLFEILLPLIDLKVEKNETPSEKLSVCNNSIWTIGLLGIYFPEKSVKYIDTIFEKFKEILVASKVSFYF